MKTFEFEPQSYKWPGFTIMLPDEFVAAFESSEGAPCSLDMAKDGSRAIVRVHPGTTHFIRALRVDGSIAIVRGHGELFLVSEGSWSGGSRLRGAIALIPGAIVRFGAKGSWAYAVCDENGIRGETHDPRLFEEGSTKWQPLA